MTSEQDQNSLSVSTVSIKLTPFWTTDPELRFVQVESQFAARRITSDLTRYHHVMSSLPPATDCEIRDLLLAPPAEEAYKTPKRTLIRWVTPSESQHLQRLLHEAELGDRTPSQLLRHMQHVRGTTTAGLDSILLGELLFQRLPTSVRMGLTSVEETNLCKLAELADRLMAVPPSALSAVQAEPTTPDQLQEIRAEISHLNDTVAALRAPDSRPSSQGNTPRLQQRF